MTNRSRSARPKTESWVTLLSGVPRVEDRRDPREPAKEPPSRDEKEDEADAPPPGNPDDPAPDPDRLVDVRVAPHALPTRQLLPGTECGDALR